LIMVPAMSSASLPSWPVSGSWVASLTPTLVSKKEPLLQPSYNREFLSE
jgi:hypothetical protein